MEIQMKLLIVRSAEASSWGSCKVISPNLQETYKRLPKNFNLTWFDLPGHYIELEMSTLESPIINLSKRIMTERPDRIIFLDHSPNPAEILNKLSLIMDLDKLPAILFHIYGDFTYFSRDWLNLSPKLINHPIKFLTASLSQKKLLSHFTEDSSVVDQFCFPVNSKDYYFDPEARDRLRKEYRVGPEDIVILYSGRISLQKNVDLLIKEYLKLITNSKHCVHLWLVGGFDDLGAPFMGVDTDEGYLFSKIESFLAPHPKTFTNKIKFWGLQTPEKLREIKSAADLFISLSLYHDEDYGMSPAEAMATGLPSLLTDWGGYSSFASTSWRCKLIPVAISEFGLQIKTSAIRDFFEGFVESYINDNDRKRWSEAFIKNFSIEDNILKLESFIKGPFNLFQGFNWQLAPCAQLYGKSDSPKTIDPSTGPSDKNFYSQIYQNYISLNESVEGFKDTETIQWIYDYLKNSESDQFIEKRKKIRSYHHYLSPFSKNYYGTFNPALMLNGKTTNKLIDKKLWTLRDGLIPLYYFFEEHTPELFSGEIAIHKEMWFLVPKRWRDKVVLYETRNHFEYSKNNLPKKIFITGMFNSMFSDLQYFEKELIHLSEALGQNNLENIEILAYFPSKKSNLETNWKEENLLHYSQLLFKHLGKNIQLTDWKGVTAHFNFKETLYFEINEGHYIKDTYTKHFALSRGAGLLPNPSEEIKGELIKFQNLSLYHSMVIYRPDYSQFPVYLNPIDNDFYEYYKNMIKSNQSGPNSTTSWDSRLISYLKKFYKLHPLTNR